jgi:AcrR family transcriptional regulator
VHRSTREPARRENSSAKLLIDTAAALLTERVSLDVSLGEIAARSHLNSALIKYYFGNKEGLLLAVLEQDTDVAMAALDQLVSLSISAEQKLRLHITGIINSFYKRPYLNRLIHFLLDGGSKDVSLHVSSIFILPMLKAYRAIIDQGIEEGTFKNVDPIMLYYSLVGAADYLFSAAPAVRLLTGESEVSDKTRREYIAHVVETFLNGVLVHRPQ